MDRWTRFKDGASALFALILVPITGPLGGALKGYKDRVEDPKVAAAGLHLVAVCLLAAAIVYTNADDARDGWYAEETRRLALNNLSLEEKRTEDGKPPLPKRPKSWAGVVNATADAVTIKFESFEDVVRCRFFYTSENGEHRDLLIRQIDAKGLVEWVIPKGTFGQAWIPGTQLSFTLEQVFSDDTTVAYRGANTVRLR